MYSCRVTKYDPALRDAQGHYTLDEWTFFAQVGGDVSREEYLRVETAYIDVAIAFLREAGVVRLTVTRLQDPNGVSHLHNGQGVDVDGLEPTLRGVLREQFGARFESESAYVHFAWDYYMYLGIPRRCPQATALARTRDLFVEDCESPYASAGERAAARR